MRHWPIAALLLLTACADPAAQWLGGYGDPVRGAALSAPDMLSDTSRLAGRPAEAALAAVQLEVVTSALREDPRYRSEASGAALHATEVGRDDLRRAIGIAPDAPSQSVIASLRDVAAALRAGRPARAEAALSGPDYPLGPSATLQRLSSLPALPRVSEAAAAAHAEIGRLDGRVRGGRG